MNLFAFTLTAAFFTSIIPVKSVLQTHPQQQAEMINTPTHPLKNLAAYNTWANQQLANWLQEADSVQWQQQVESSFNSLELTVRHLWNAEHGWLCTLKKEPWKQAIETDVAMSKTAVLSGFLATSKTFENFVCALSDTDFQDVRTLGKDQKNIDLTGIIQHVFNHATYHRGQLITIGRQVGLPAPPRTDYIFFLMQ
jgi:uncharacterized damage-inducible protein DinB